MPVEQTVEREGESFFSTYRHGQCLYQMFLVAEYRNQLLLSVAKCAAIGYHPTTQYLVFITDGKHEVHANCLACLNGELLFLCVDNLLRHRIEKNHAYCSCLRLASHVRDRGSNRGLIAHTHETWQIRGQHKFFTGSSFSVQRSH